MTLLKRAACTAIAAFGLLGVAACNQSEADAPTDAATPGLVKGVTISNARLVLAPVAGNPAAVYFNLSYAGAAGVALSTVKVEGAGHTMIHDYGESAGMAQMIAAKPIALSAEVPVTFAPGGLHVMAMQPSMVWKPGETVKVTLTLSDGTTHSFDAAVRAAGEER